ncbi:hypothetical protein OE88DRAFT_832970 [Heliocybe sulcata]|uniref:XPG-I domain-containing protein n=1 Tax=Heliocybe sulcata TaxID=5364 RepID=A0A5C3MQM1_9AGAM|nr:hypothetical protein OE88DRAFT_832970 [Heliocybe sulcata]
MGVPGLWDVLRPSGQVRSLTHLAVVDGFDANPTHRGLRIGIDASIWFFHATYGREGENPELRTLFFRCCRLMTTPFLPLFVFDGPKRPKVKRGKRVSGNAHWMTTGMKNIIEAFGFEWRTAPGEAEAELAYLSRIGVIDAVLSDDVDNFLFGATMVIRNPSATLSGNKAHPVKNSAGRDDGNHSVIYTSSALLKHPDIGLTLGGLILIGLLSGGDYHQAGLASCGIKTAHALARCGFGDSLLEAVSLPEEELDKFLEDWRQQIRHELKTNSRGFMARKSPSLAKTLPDDFPNIEILMSYARPITSESEGKRIRVDWTREPDLGKVAGLCELYFEWGVKDIIIKRFRTVLWPSAVLRILRRAVLDKDDNPSSVPVTPRKKNKRTTPIGTPSSMIAKHFSSMVLNSPTRADDEDEEEERLIIKIHSERRHPSTDGILEYRLEIAPAQLARLSAAGVKGIRPPESFASSQYSDDDEEEEEDEEGGAGGKKKKGGKKPPPDPESHLRVWMPASMVRMAEPALVEEYEAVLERKAAKKAGKGAKKSPTKAKDVAKKAKDVARKAKELAKPKTTKVAGAKKNMISLYQSDSASESEDDIYSLDKNPTTKKAAKTSSALYESHSESDSDGILNTKGKARKTAPLSKWSSANTAPTLYDSDSGPNPNSDAVLHPTKARLKQRAIPTNKALTSVGSSSKVKSLIDLMDESEEETDPEDLLTAHATKSRPPTNSGLDVQDVPKRTDRSRQKKLYDLLSINLQGPSTSASNAPSSSSRPGSGFQRRAPEPFPMRLDEDSDGDLPLRTSSNSRGSSGQGALPGLISSTHASTSFPSSNISGAVPRGRQELPLRMDESDGCNYGVGRIVKARQRTVDLRSGSDSDRHQPRKSPRKSANSSPRGTHSERRPVSPSPRGKAGTKLVNWSRPAPKALDIIELSSESDAEARLPIAPLLLARARQRPQPAGSKAKQFTKLPAKSSRRPTEDLEVIDLT